MSERDRQYQPDYEIEGPHRRARERRWGLLLLLVAALSFSYFLTQL